jgi:nucleotide sugar dehydrogenase
MIFDIQKIGFIGLGFVGEAIREHYNGFERICIDTDVSKGYVGTYKEIMNAEGIFVCVPSPQRADGSCNTDILENVLDNLKDYKGVIISKVTATPDIYERLGKKYPNLVHVPEFLTAANAVRDYRNSKFAIIGGSVLAYQHEAARIVKYINSDISTTFCSIEEASLVKYIINSFLATKVVFMNEMAALVEANGGSWSNVARMVLQDNRIGGSHMQVPGPDGQYGFGGMCFPKDTTAIIKHAETLNINLHVLKEAVKKNTILRLQKPK